MKYSASMVSRHFWYMEAKKTARLILDGLSKSEIEKVVILENLYQAPSEAGSKHMFGSIHTRLSSLDEYLLDKIVSADVTTSRAIVLISVMKTDSLFFEFVYEVYREKYILGDSGLTDRDINTFFDRKLAQSETIQKWTEYTIKRLKNCYTRMLFEAGLIDSSQGDKKATIISLDHEVENYLRKNDMAAYADAIKGTN